MNLLNWYLKPKSVDADGKLYERLGIQTFKKITPFEILGRIQNRKIKTLKKLNTARLKKYSKDTVAGEIAYLFSFVFILSVSLLFVIENLNAFSMMLLLINILVNLYPIFLMRYNRFEISRVLKISVTEMLNK